jgi:hypothetical protein
MKRRTLWSRSVSALVALLLAVLLAGPGKSAALHVAANDPTPITKETIRPEIPKEVVDGDGKDLPVQVGHLPIDFFDDFSWRSFLALNWPAKPDVRGVANTNADLKDVTSHRVWETWKADYEAFRQDLQASTAWESFDSFTPCPDIPFMGGGKPRLLAAFSKFGNILEATADGVGPPLVGQNHTYTRYEVRMNQAEYETIVSNKLYLRATLNNPHMPFVFAPNSIEVKASWRELKDEEVQAAKSRYYVINAKVQNPQAKPACDDRFMALVGFHIVQKTPLRPQWVWSSFEHVDNVPAPSISHPAGSFSYNNPSDPQELDPPEEPPPLAVPEVNPKPMQVVRKIDIRNETKDTNKRYQKALAGTIWDKYQLVVTQWPTDTSDPSGKPFPGTTMDGPAANTTLETWRQTIDSCMGCHDTARANKGKTDFVWFVQLRAQPPDPQFFKQLARVFRERAKKR